MRQFCCCFEGGGVGRGEFDVGVGVGGAAGNVVDDFFAGDAGDDDGLIFVEVFAPRPVDAGDGDGLVAGEVFAADSRGRRCTGCSCRACRRRRRSRRAAARP